MMVLKRGLQYFCGYDVEEDKKYSGLVQLLRDDGTRGSFTFVVVLWEMAKPYMKWDPNEGVLDLGLKRNEGCQATLRQAQGPVTQGRALEALAASMAMKRGLGE